MHSDSFDAARLETLFDAVGLHLEAAGTTASIIVVGGAALALRGWVARTTHDVDVIALAVGPDRDLAPPDLPKVLVAVVARVARDFNLPENWLNSAVGAQFKKGLPMGLISEIEWRQFHGLAVGLAGRSTLIALKLFAAVDSGIESVHCQDLIALAPTAAELARAEEWVALQDIAPQWPRMVSEVVNHVRGH